MFMFLHILMTDNIKARIPTYEITIIDELFGYFVGVIGRNTGYWRPGDHIKSEQRRWLRLVAHNAATI